MRTKEYANQEWWRRTVGKAWQTVGANLFEAAVPASIRSRIQGASDSSGTVLKVRLSFEDDSGRLLEPYPWEYLQVGRGPSTVPMEGDAPTSDLPLPLAVRSGLLIERVPRSRRLTWPASHATSLNPEVAVVNALPDPMSALAARTVQEIKALPGVNLMFELNGIDATWPNVIDALEKGPHHLVLYVPVNRDRRAAELGFCRGPDRYDDWRSAGRLVQELKDRGIELDSLVIMTFAAAPGIDTVRGTFELARNFSDQGVGPVVFGCHWPGFERSVSQARGPEPETFVGMLIHALSEGAPLDRCMYYARSQVMRRNEPEFEVLFGVPGFYGVESPGRARSAAEASGVPSTRSATISRRAVR
jgi:hypothetical protein